VLLVGIREGDPHNGALLEIASREEANPAYRVRIRRLLRAALERDPEDIRIATRLSAVDHQLGENELALSRLEDFRQKGPLPPETRLLRARLLAATGDLATARTELEELFQNRPDLKGILPVLLATLLELNDKPGTLAALERGERFGLLGAGRYLLFGTLLLEAGDQNEARRVLEKAVLSGSLSPEVLSQLALLYARENVDLEKAEYYAGRAVAESGESSESLDTLGFVLLERGQNQAAAQKLEEALEAAGPNDPTSAAGTHYRLGVARQRLGQAELAQRHFARAHLLDPRIAVPGPADPKNEL
jgi:tetratricopeptide (TPR) repeat protein